MSSPPITQQPLSKSTEIVDANGRPTAYFLAYLRQGFTGTITTAKLTGGGANGSMTFYNGILMSRVAAT